MMDRFLADKSPNAYEKIVNELMKSPAYGEKMALHWLDVAHVMPIRMVTRMTITAASGPGREWVIHAFNEDLPYNKFITWQLADDLMPNAAKNSCSLQASTAIIKLPKRVE